MRVLLVEDDPDLLDVTSYALRKSGHEVLVATDGETAVQRWQAEQPDLVLLDLNLPKYDGRQVLERIKGDPDLATIPVVVLTTSSAEEDIVRSYKLHANAYVTKPVDLDQFIEAVRQIDDFFVSVVRLPGR
jgi:two-component system response regulator